MAAWAISWSLSSFALLATPLGDAAGSAAPENRVASAEYGAGDNWSYYNGNAAGTHYSQLSDIDVSNVDKLRIAWTYDTNEKLASNSTIESNPLVVDGRLFFVSSNGRLISLDGATGRERWIFDPGADSANGMQRWRRGVSYWSDGLQERVYFTFDDYLYAVDARTGGTASGFGSGGRIALGTLVSSPGAIFEDFIITGGSASRIRAFDARTGALRWTFNTIPRPGEFGYDTWPKDAWKSVTGANNWGGVSVDAKRGIVFVPLAFPQSFYGAHRRGDNLFANCLVALDARTGKRLWHFQTIRHDIWDRDLPAAPTLVTVARGGKRVDAVAQVSKIGFVYLLDRLTGKSLFPVVERPALRSDVPGEVVAKSQPEPQLPAPFARQHLTADLLTQRTPEVAKAVAAQFATLRSRGLWEPPSVQGTIVFPSLEGGALWGGAAYDPNTSLLYVNSNELPSIVRLKKRLDGVMTGASLYRDYCAGCHGQERQGIPPEFPSLVGIGERRSFNQIVTKIASGSGRMPAFQALATDYTKVWPLIEYLKTGIDVSVNDAPIKKRGEGAAESEYVLEGMEKFVDPDGYPAVSPPWGTLNAINLSTGQYVWRVPFGEYPELVAQGLKNTGSPNYGGPIATAGGLLFIGATSFDKKFRAYHSRTGELLWETVLPAAGNATPSTYRANGRQFVVIAAGGGRPPTAASGTTIVAFALPSN